MHAARKSAFTPARAGTLGALLLAGIPLAGLAQSYPVKPVRMIMPFPAGGASDILARIIAAELSKALGQNMIIDNRGGAAGNIGTEIAARAAPDGYTIALGNISTHSINPALYKLPHDVVRDFAPIGIIGVVTNMLVVHPSIPARSVRDLLALARARPGQVDYASAGSGSPAHLAGAMFNALAGVKLNHIPYKGNAPATSDLVAGHVGVMFNAMPAAVPHVQAKRLRALAVTTATRSRGAPDVPTIAEAGVPGYDLSAWHGLFAPAGTPRPIVDRLSAEMAKAVRIPAVAERLIALGTEPVGNTPDEFAAIVRADLVRYAKAVADSGAKAD
jgi:tripartite-type tricarboxylate transporter receptor subunit TctC